MSMNVEMKGWRGMCFGKVRRKLEGGVFEFVEKFVREEIVVKW